jgi:thiol-disulfide isomerase/thioredoxin
MLVENLEVQGQPGVARAFDVRGTSNHVVLSFTARGEVPELKDLGAYAAWADGMLKEREIRDVNLRGMRNPIEEAGLAFVARSYVNKRGAAGAVCDAAGVRFETPGGFWTITWNADLGKIEASMPVIREVLQVMEIERVGGGVVAAGPAAVLSPGSPAPALEVREWIRGAPIDALSAEGTYVVEFWATWCGPCAESIPHLTEMAKAHANVRFVGISVLEDNDKQQVQEFVAKMSDALG